MPQIVDLTGKRFGRLTVIERDENKRQSNGKTVVMWKCYCDCGKYVTTSGRNLRYGSTKSCGCYHEEVMKKCNNHRIKDITGKRFGKLIALRRVGYKNGYIWECKCDCGNLTEVSLANLNSGHIKSCGCSNKGIIRNYVHGNSRKRIYKEYYGMISRCKQDAKCKKDYYDRGITVCDEWLGENGFINFYNWAMANGYRDDLTIDRKDNNKGYSPDNCRWATQKQQANNKRKNKYIKYNGEKKTLSEWSEYLGFDYKKVKSKMQRGIEFLDAISD